MPSTRPEYLSGHYYHFFNRGAHRLSIFREPDNYRFALDRVEHYCEKLALAPVAYCLMPNHYHFLIRQGTDHSAGLLPQRLFNSYSKAYNKRYDHSGTLFEGNYKVRWVQDTTYLLHLCRYIHANPAADGLVVDPADWPYSNYLEWIGERDSALVDREFIRQHFRSAEEYRRFVLDYLEEERASSTPRGE